MAIKKNTTGTNKKTSTTGSSKKKTTRTSTSKTTTSKYISADTQKKLSNSQSTYDAIKPFSNKYTKSTKTGLNNARTTYAGIGDYSPQYTDKIASLTSSIENRKPFNYNPDNDVVYQQLLKNYQAKGNIAMQDAMANAAALSGGYGNSYAQTVGQQVYNQHIQEAANQIPALYEAAYNRYRDEGQDLYSQLDMYRGLDDTEYGRYRDKKSDAYNDLTYWQGVADNEKNFNYQQYQDNVAKAAGDRDYYTNLANNEQTFKYQQYIDALARAAAAKKSSGGSGKSSGKSSGTSKKNTGTNNSDTTNIFGNIGTTNNNPGIGSGDNSTTPIDTSSNKLKSYTLQAISYATGPGGRESAYNYIRSLLDRGAISEEEKEELIEYIRYGSVTGITSNNLSGGIPAWMELGGKK
jgi:hypothetical protein